jgi:hypothetical protein
VLETTRFGAVLALVTALTGCDRPGARVGYTLVEKGPYQAVYRADGRAERLAYDGDGDGRVEAITFFGPSGRLARAESDTDRDGRIDRWEVYDDAGRLLRVGRALHGGDRPQAWDYADAAGGFSRREFDEDGNGKPERIEHIVDGRIVAEDLDADADGRCERRLVKNADGRTIRIETDADGDGVYESQRAVIAQP